MITLNLFTFMRYILLLLLVASLANCKPTAQKEPATDAPAFIGSTTEPGEKLRIPKDAIVANLGQTSAGQYYINWNQPLRWMKDELERSNKTLSRKETYYIFPFSHNMGCAQGYHPETRTYDFGYVFNEGYLSGVDGMLDVLCAAFQPNPLIQWTSEKYNTLNSLGGIQPNVETTLHIPVDEATAQKIETNSKDMAIVFAFNMQRTCHKPDEKVLIFIGGRAWTYLVNLSTMEVYLRL